VCARARARRWYVANRSRKIAYVTAYQATPKGYLSHVKGTIVNRMRAKEARLSQLEATLDASA